MWVLSCVWCTLAYWKLQRWIHEKKLHKVLSTKSTVKGFTDHSSALWSTFCLVIPSFCSSKWPECTEDWQLKIFYPRNYIELNWTERQCSFWWPPKTISRSALFHYYKHRLQHSNVSNFDHRLYLWLSYNYQNNQRLFSYTTLTCCPCNRCAVCFNWILVLLRWMSGFCILKVRPHRTRSAAADCGLCPLRNVTF